MDRHYRDERRFGGACSIVQPNEKKTMEWTETEEWGPEEGGVRWLVKVSVTNFLHRR